jgi:hypothetical protein
MSRTTGAAASPALSETETKIVALRDHMRAAILRTDDPQAKAMLETSAEVLGGLRQAFADYAEGSETAWQH